MPHPSEHTSPSAPLGPEEATAIAESMSVFATPSRVRILYALAGRELTVEELAAEAGLEASAASHQLRVLRQLHFVVAERDGRNVRYRVHDLHVEELLAAVRHHHEHAVAGWSDRPAAPNGSRESRH